MIGSLLWMPVTKPANRKAKASTYFTPQGKEVI